MTRHRCHCGRRFILAASLHLHIATTHLLDNPQAAWDQHCATTPGLSQTPLYDALAIERGVAELAAVTTYADFLAATGGNA